MNKYLFICRAIVFAVLFSSDSVFSETNKNIVFQHELSGKFIQEKTISILPNPLMSDGSFQFSYSGSSPNLVWTTASPIESVLYFDDQGVRQEVGGTIAWDVAADQPAVATLTQVITGVLASDWSVLENFFDINILKLSEAELEDKTEEWRSSTVVELVAKEANLKTVIESMIVFLPPLNLLTDFSMEDVTLKNLSNSGGLVKKLIMYEANGDRTEIMFSFLSDQLITNE